MHLYCQSSINYFFVKLIQIFNNKKHCIHFTIHMKCNGFSARCLVTGSNRNRSSGYQTMYFHTVMEIILITTVKIFVIAKFNYKYFLSDSVANQ